MSNSRHRLDSRARTKVFHIISDLKIGGAERMLVALMRTLAEARFDSTVLSLMRCGALAVVRRQKELIDLAGRPRSGFTRLYRGARGAAEASQPSEPDIPAAVRAHHHGSASNQRAEITGW